VASSFRKVDLPQWHGHPQIDLAAVWPDVLWKNRSILSKIAQFFQYIAQFYQKSPKMEPSYVSKIFYLRKLLIKIGKFNDLNSQNV
jgi:hypothetical protein